MLKGRQGLSPLPSPEWGFCALSRDNLHPKNDSRLRGLKRVCPCIKPNTVFWLFPNQGSQFISLYSFTRTLHFFPNQIEVYGKICSLYQHSRRQKRPTDGDTTIPYGLWGWEPEPRLLSRLENDSSCPARSGRFTSSLTTQKHLSVWQERSQGLKRRSPGDLATPSIISSNSPSMELQEPLHKAAPAIPCCRSLSEAK